MSTLSISPAFDEQFDTLVRTAFVPAAGDPARGESAGLDEAFDLDYGHRRLVPLQRTAPVEPLLAPVARPAEDHTRIRRQTRTVQPARQRVRLTRRGRVAAVLVLLGLALTLMTTMGGWAVASLDAGTPESVRIVEVAPGETLYGIAGDLAEPGEVRDMVHRIQELNSLSGSEISEGQKLAVPRG